MLDLLLSALNDCVIIFDLDEQRHVFISPKVEAIFGYTPEALRQDPGIHNKRTGQPAFENTVSSAPTMQEGEWVELKYELISLGGEAKYIHEKRRLMADAGSGHQMLVSIIKEADDTDKPFSLAGQTFLFDRSPTPMWIFDRSSLQILKVNESACKMYGYTEAEFLSLALRQLRPASEYGRFDEFINSAEFKGDHINYKHAGAWKHVNKDGGILYAETTTEDVTLNGRRCRIVVAEDVTAEIHFREAFDMREQFLNSLIDSQTNFLIRINSAGIFTFVNKQFLKTLGYRKSDIIGRHFSIISIPEDIADCESALRYCLKHPGRVIRLNHKKRNKGGHLHDTEWEFIAVTNADGNVTEIQGVGQDVTHKMRTETEAKNAAEKLDAFIESIPDYFIMLDNDQRFMRLNAAFEKATGRSRDELLGRDVWDAFPVVKGSSFEKICQQALEYGGAASFTGYVEAADKWFNASVYPSAEGSTAFIKDITDEKRAQEEIIWTKNDLVALIDNTKDLIWSIDRHRKYLYTNTAYRNKIFSDTGVTPIKGDHVYMTTDYENEIIKEWEGYYKRAFSGEVFNVLTSNLDRQTQQTLYFETSFNPIYKSKEEITGIGCFARNITDRLEIENAIIEQNERLHHIASLSSHELRRPIASMLGLIGLMDRTDLYNPENKEIIEHLFTVGLEIDSVIHLINDQTFTKDLPPVYRPGGKPT